MALGMAKPVGLLTFVVQSETSIGWIAMKCGTDFYVPLRMNCNDVGDPFIFPQLPGHD